MTPDEERDARVLDGLLKSFGEMSVAVARQDERIGSHDGQLKAIRSDHRAETAEIKRAVYGVGEACNKRIGELEDRIESEIKSTAARAEARRERNEVTLGQKLVLGVALFGIFLSPILTVVLR